MARVTISRLYDFEAAHFLPKVPDGHKCKTMHGHSYEVEVLVTGNVQEEGPEAGMVLDFGRIDDAFSHVRRHCDHQTLNATVHGNPTVENIAPAVWQMLSVALIPAGDDSVSLRLVFREGPRSACYYPPLD